jgi:hypothetical protein
LLLVIIHDLRVSAAISQTRLQGAYPYFGSQGLRYDPTDGHQDAIDAFVVCFPPIHCPS